jgi:hypothetical protein
LINSKIKGFLISNALLFFAVQSAAQINQLSNNNSIINLKSNEIQESLKLKNVLKKLHNVYLNNQFQNLKNPIKGDTLFTIMHIGDSHVQGDYFSGEIRMQLQYQFGNAGRGILFPYALAKSFGPKGVSVKQSGIWTGLKTMSSSLAEPIGVAGYCATTSSPYSKIQVSLTEKFREENALGVFSTPEFQKIKVWHSTDNQSFRPQLDSEWRLIDSFTHQDGWGFGIYESSSVMQSFNLNLSRTDAIQNHFAFYGFEILPTHQKGVVYHHLGVVGAQFTHLINKAPHTIAQIGQIKPDILIFSFGTNEAYNGKLDTAVYTPAIMNFIDQITRISPNTAIIFTTAPDTRSNNRIPPVQVKVNNQLRRIAMDKNLTLYDLNEAMGGWGSMYAWYQNKLTISDKLHFNKVGYALQGQLFSFSLLNAYNRVNKNDQLKLDSLTFKVSQGMDMLSMNRIYVPQETNNASDTATKIDSVHAPIVVVPRYRAGEVIHVVKHGETLYRIALNYHVSVAAIAKKNKLNMRKKLKYGIKLKIPKVLH